MWNVQFGIAVVIGIVGFVVKSVASDRSIIGVAEAVLAGAVLAGGWLLVKRFIFRSYEN